MNAKLEMQTNGRFCLHVVLGALFLASGLVLAPAKNVAAQSSCEVSTNALLACAAYQGKNCNGQQPADCCYSTPGAGGCATCDVTSNGETWTIVEARNNEDNDFNAVAFQKVNPDGTKETVIAYRGTTSGADWVNNLESVYAPTLADQYDDALQFYKDISSNSEKFGQVAVTGHSLGGGLAMFVADQTGTNAVTFNALGLSTGVDASGEYGGTANIANYYHADDPINCINLIKEMHVVGNSIVDDYAFATAPYCEEAKAAYAKYLAHLQSPACMLVPAVCAAAALVDLGTALGLIGSMTSAHEMAPLLAALQGSCDSVQLPQVGDLPHAELPVVPDLPHVALPVVPELPKAELSTVPGLPHFELPTVPDLPHFELPTVPDLPQFELPR